MFGKNKVLKMLKALYGLRQSPHKWHKMIAKVLKKMGLQPNPTDECVFSMRNEKGQVVIVALYVDDLIITGDWSEKVAEVEATLLRKFKMRDVTDDGNVRSLELSTSMIVRSVC